MPPTSSSASSVVVTSTVPASSPSASNRSIERPPVPLALNTSVSNPRSSSSRRTRVTHGVVTPNIVAPISGRSVELGAKSSRALAMPAIAPAAFHSTRSEKRFRPAMSTTG
jgi:hypothetical protein